MYCVDVSIEVAAHTSMHTIAGPCRIRAVCFLSCFFLLRICKKVLCPVPIISCLSVKKNLLCCANANIEVAAHMHTIGSSARP